MDRFERRPASGGPPRAHRTGNGCRRNGMEMGSMTMDRGRGVGILLIALGALFLIGQFVDVGRVVWPFFVMAPGVALLAWAFVGGRGAAGLAVPGSIVTTVGLILFVMNATNTFYAWSYAWALVLASVGAGTFLYGSLVHDEKRQRDGLRTVSIGLVLFAVFGVFFQFVVFGNMWDSWLTGWLLPLLLIGAGVYLIYARREGTSGTVTGIGGERPQQGS